MKTIAFGQVSCSTDVRFKVGVFSNFIGIDLERGRSAANGYQRIAANITPAEARTLRKELKAAIRQVEGKH